MRMRWAVESSAVASLPAVLPACLLHYPSGRECEQAACAVSLPLNNVHTITVNHLYRLDILWSGWPIRALAIIPVLLFRFQHGERDPFVWGRFRPVAWGRQRTRRYEFPTHRRTWWETIRKKTAHLANWAFLANHGRLQRKANLLYEMSIPSHTGVLITTLKVLALPPAGNLPRWEASPPFVTSPQICFLLLYHSIAHQGRFDYSQFALSYYHPLCNYNQIHIIALFLFIIPVDEVAVPLEQSYNL